MKKTCKQCHTNFQTLPCYIRKGGGKYCTIECYRLSQFGRKFSPETKRKISESKLGDLNSSKRPEVREKIRQTLLGRDNGGNTKVCVTCKTLFKDCPSNKTVNCSRECSSKYFSQFCGEKSHSWQGGKTSKAMKARNSKEMKQWRISVFTRDDFTCQKCGQRGGKIQADHDLPFALYPGLRFEVLNGQTLCVRCHRDKTKKDMVLIKQT